MNLTEVDPKTFLAARTDEFVAWGIRKADITAAHQEIERFDGSDSNSWVGFWRSKARHFATKQPIRACLCLGAAKYPLLGSPALNGLMAEQLTLLQSAQTAGQFERRVVEVTVNERVVKIPYHLYGRRWMNEGKLVCICGGLDTYKFEMHQFALVLSNWIESTLVVIDMPGTGETTTEIDVNGEALFTNLFDCVMPHRRQICFLGMSFGGYWALRLAFGHMVQSAIDIGGPVGIDQNPSERLGSLPADMIYILTSAFRLNNVVEAGRLLDRLSDQLRRLLLKEPVPILALNGDADPYIPRSDISFLSKYPNTTIVIVPGAGHCAASKLWRFVPKIVGWARTTTGGSRGWTMVANVADSIISTSGGPASF